jgi:phosphotransferase family enzyme
MPAEARAVGEDRKVAWDGLRPFATPPAWLTALGDPSRVGAELASLVPELAQGDLRLKTCEVSRVRLKESGLTALYRLEVAAGDGRPVRTAYLRGRFVPFGQPEPDVAVNGAALGSAEWHCWIPELRLQLATEAPKDRALPALSLLTDAEKARALLERGIRSSPRHADLRIEACSPKVARYNRGSRCTVVYQLDFSRGARPLRWPETVVAKIHHGTKGQNAYEGMLALWSSGLRLSRNVTIAEPLAFLSEPKVLIQTGIPNQRTLEEFLSSTLRAPTPQPMDELFSCLAKTAAGLADLHVCGVRPPNVVTFEDELAEARTSRARLGGLIPELAEAATRLLARLEAFAREHPADPIGPAHRSFRPAQVLLDGDAVGFIDFDGFCRAEPAIDVALFRAVVAVAGLQALQAKEGPRLDGNPRAKHLAKLDELCDAFSARYEAAAPVSRHRVALWEALYLLTFVIHSWTKVEFGSLDARLGLLRHRLRAGELGS